MSIINAEGLESYKGCVIRLREANYCYDSDFYATVWDMETCKPLEILYKTTRGFCGNSFASIDANEDILSAYDNYISECRRRKDIISRWQYRKEFRQASINYDIPAYKFVKLHLYLHNNPGLYDAIAKLVNAKLTSDYKKSLAKQVCAWILEDKPKFNCPLSPKQISTLMR